MSDNRLTLLRTQIRDYPDFPKPGILFKDVFSLFSDPECFPVLMELVCEKAASMKGQIDCVVGLDARGFLFGPSMARAAGVVFVPVISY